MEEKRAQPGEGRERFHHSEHLLSSYLPALRSIEHMRSNVARGADRGQVAQGNDESRFFGFLQPPGDSLGIERRSSFSEPLHTEERCAASGHVRDDTLELQHTFDPRPFEHRS